MKISIEPYNPQWVNQFEKIKQELLLLIHDFEPQIEHFGSTSVPDLAAKPIIDVLVGIQDLNQLDALVQPMMKDKRYIYYKAFNPLMPERRLFVRLKDPYDNRSFSPVFEELPSIPHEVINQYRYAHVHIWKYGSDDWIRHIAFRDYLKAHPEIMEAYQELKLNLSQQDWKHGMEYNDGKNKFIKTEEKKAIDWYKASL